MTPLNRKLCRDIILARGQLAAVAAIMAVGVAAYVGMSGTCRNLEAAKRSYYTRCQMADFWVHLKKAPVSEVAALSAMDDVAALRTRISYQVTVDLDDVARPLTGLVVSMPAERRAVINDIVLKRGGYFSRKRRNEVIVSDDFATKRGLTPGDRVHLLLNNQRKELFVVGTADSSEFTYLVSPGGIVPDPANYGVFYIKRRYAEEVFDFEGACNEVVGRLVPSAQRRPERVLQTIETRLATFGVISKTALKQQPSNFILTNEIQQGKEMATMLSSIFLLVAALVLNVLLSRMAEQQRTVVGTLKAIGYTNRQILRHFFGFGIVVGAMAGLAGWPGGYWLSHAMTNMYRPIFDFPRLDNQLYPSLMAQGMVMSLVFAVLGTLRGVRAVQRLKPAEAMRPRPPQTGRSVILERWRWFWHRLGFQTQMVLRGLFRTRVRTLVGIFAAAMGAAIMVAAFYYRDAFVYLIQFQYEEIDRSDYTLVFRDERGDGALAEVRDLPGVNRAEPLLTVAGTLHHGRHRKKSAITGVKPDAQLTVPRDANAERVRVPRTGLLLTRQLAEILHAQPGDRLTLIPNRGLRRPVDVPVVRVVDSYLGLGAYADIDYLDHVVGEASALNQIQLSVDRGLRTRRALYRELKRLPTLQAVVATRQAKENVEDEMLKMMTTMAYFLIAIAAVIYSGSILNAALISISERQREIATLRVLGYGPRAIGGIFLRESLIVNVVGALLGLPLGYFISLASAAGFDSELFRMPRVIQPISLVVTVVLAIVMCLASHFIVQTVINKMDWREAIKVKE